MTEPSPLSQDQGRKDTRVLLAILACLVLLLVPAHLYNRQLFRFLNNAHSPYTDLLWLTFTTLGDGLVLGTVMGAFLVKNPRVSALGILLLVFCSVAVNTVKLILPSPRPPAMLEGVHLVGPLLRSGSFPSGHAASGFCAGLAVWYCVNSKATGIVAVLGGAMIGLSRIFVGVHFPTDVIGGAICATVCLLVLKATVWPHLARDVPTLPDSTRWSFRLALRVEVLAAGFVVLVWGPFCSELPASGVGIGLAVLAIVGPRYWRLR